MATVDLPYMSSAGNVPAILDKMRSAGTPPKFTLDFLKSSLGFTASQDRAFPRVLKQLGFLSPDGVPLPRYNEFKSTTTGGRAMAAGLREGWAPLFLADEQIHTKPAGELKEICKQVTGQGDSAAEKIAALFRALVKKADFSAPATNGGGAAATEDRSGTNGGTSGGDGGSGSSGEEGADVDPDRSTGRDLSRVNEGQLNLHQDIHVHLPPTSDVSVYRAIFRALREELR